jgi:biopolymer transport protein ExbD
MAMQAGRRDGPTAQINVTPMADIMIVLLIIFMVTAPLIARSGVSLPTAAHAARRGATPIVVVLALDRSLGLEGSTARDPASISSEIRLRFDDMAEGARVVYLKADAGLGYADVRRVLDLLRDLGADDIALMTVPRVGA